MNDKFKIALCEINTTPRDFRSNFDKIYSGLHFAAEEGADLAIFPELCIPGYLTRDMIYDKNYVKENLKYLQELVTESKCCQTAIVVGYIDFNHKGVGKPFRNMAAVIQNGIVIATYAKQLLPFYDVFDEGRYFEPGTELAVFKLKGTKFGLCICEDIWCDKFGPEYDYIKRPLEAYREIGVRNIISINSSPYQIGKPEHRINMVNRSTISGNTIIYVNQIGGQDELVFDGNSFVSADGYICHIQTKQKKQEEGCNFAIAELISSDKGALKKHPMLFYKPDHKQKLLELENILITGIRDYVHKNGFKEVVFGSSGGIDSALLGYLACKAVGPEYVHGLRMPSCFSSDHSSSDAKQLHLNLNCSDYEFPIQHMGVLDAIKTSFLRKNHKIAPVADENIQARLRGAAVMWFSNAYGALALVTGNKTELALGYCTIGGDMMGGFGPISDLYKTQVQELAEFANRNGEMIPKNILTKPPSAELAPDQTDEASLMPYVLLDKIVMAYIEDYIGTIEEFEQWCNKDKTIKKDMEYWLTNVVNGPEPDLASEARNQYRRMIRLIDLAEHKRRVAVPGIKVSKVAFGSGRRLPITKAPRS